jgi:hypothetical protein
MLTESFMKMLNKVGLRLSPCFMPISDLKQLLKLLSIFTLRTLHEYIDLIILKWGLSMNYKKTKIMIFNKGGKLIKCSFSVNDYKLECVKEYKYLGLLIISTKSSAYNRQLIDSDPK